MRHSLAAMVCLVLSSILSWMNPALAQQPQPQEADHEQLRALKAVYERAVAEEKVDLLEPHLATGFSGVMVTGDSVRSMEDLRAYWQKIKQLLGENGKYTATVNPDELSLISGDIALSKGSTQELAVTSAGKRYEFSSQWTAVCRKENGQWKLLRVQATMDPVSNVFVKAFLSRTAVGSALAGAAAGLVVGALIAWTLLRRRRPTQPVPTPG